MNNLPEDVRKFVECGYDRMKTPWTNSNREEFEIYRIIHRKWRNLVAEAKFDIPTFLHRYIKFVMPETWKELKPYKINNHDFVLKISGFLPVSINYKSFGSADWYFSKFFIGEKKVISGQYNDLSLILAMAHELPQKKEVTIEEIEGSLEDNAKLHKAIMGKNVLTEEDFATNYGPQVWD